MSFCCCGLEMEQMSPNQKGCLAEHHLPHSSQVPSSPNAPYPIIGVLPLITEFQCQRLNAPTGDCSTGRLTLTQHQVRFFREVVQHDFMLMSYVCRSKKHLPGRAQALEEWLGFGCQNKFTLLKPHINEPQRCSWQRQLLKHLRWWHSPRTTWQSPVGEFPSDFEGAL